VNRLAQSTICHHTITIFFIEDFQQSSRSAQGAAALALARAGQERKQQTGYENHIAAHASGVQFMTPKQHA